MGQCEHMGRDPETPEQTPNSVPLAAACLEKIATSQEPSLEPSPAFQSSNRSGAQAKDPVATSGGAVGGRVQLMEGTSTGPARASVQPLHSNPLTFGTSATGTGKVGPFLLSAWGQEGQTAAPSGPGSGMGAGVLGWERQSLSGLVIVTPSHPPQAWLGACWPWNSSPRPPKWPLPGPGLPGSLPAHPGP